jgi:hypothetical protein
VAAGAGEGLPAGVAEGTAGAVIRIALTVALVRVPVTTTVAPTGKALAAAGAFLVPNCVCGLICTVTVFPAFSRSVHVDPDSLMIVPRTPRPP